MLEKDKTLIDDNKVVKEFHSHFKSIVSSLGITENHYRIQKNTPSSEPIDTAIMKFQIHPSILLIKSKINANIFSFKEIEAHGVDKNTFLKKCTSWTAPVLQKLFN